MRGMIGRPLSLYGVSEEIDRQGEFYVRVSSTVKKWKIDIEELR